MHDPLRFQPYRHGKDDPRVNRALFLGTTSSLAALAAPARAGSIPGGTTFIESLADFDQAGFDRTVGRPAKIRQLYEAVSFHPAMLNNVKNSLNGLTYGFGYAPGDVALAVCPHGPSSSYGFSDAVWEKYRIGEAFALKDAQGATITRNVFLAPQHPLNDSTDPNDLGSLYQDTSIQTLQKRGVLFLTCHTAVEEQSRMLVSRGFAPAGMTPQDVANDILTHLIPGAIVVPSMVGAIAVMQARYAYTYITLAF
jgi:intracellular sulfur oxidation DsrE/DsrF family protein